MQKPLEVLLDRRISTTTPQISAAISCFNYGQQGMEALDSLLAQTENAINVIVVDDHSSDNSAELLVQWFDRHPDCQNFAHVVVVRHLRNQGLPYSRNTALSLAHTPYFFFVLDADNQVYPRALQVLREALDKFWLRNGVLSHRKSGTEPGIANNSLWMPEKFSYGNYVDAMALIRTDILRELGGYRAMIENFQGWEDYDLWCSFVDRGWKGCHVPQILCRYRVHPKSMLRALTNPLFRNSCVKFEKILSHTTIDLSIFSDHLVSDRVSRLRFAYLWGRNIEGSVQSTGFAAAINKGIGRDLASCLCIALPAHTQIFNLWYRRLDVRPIESFGG